MSLTLEQIESLITSLAVVVPPDYLKQKQLEAAFTERCAAIQAEFPDFKAHHSAARAEELFNTAGMLAGRERNFERALSVLGELERLLKSPAPPARSAEPQPINKVELTDASVRDRFQALLKAHPGFQNRPDFPAIDKELKRADASGKAGDYADGHLALDAAEALLKKAPPSQEEALAAFKKDLHTIIDKYPDFRVRTDGKAIADKLEEAEWHAGKGGFEPAYKLLEQVDALLASPAPAPAAQKEAKAAPDLQAAPQPASGKPTEEKTAPDEVAVEPALAKPADQKAVPADPTRQIQEARRQATDLQEAIRADYLRLLDFQNRFTDIQEQTKAGQQTPDRLAEAKAKQKQVLDDIKGVVDTQATTLKKLSDLDEQVGAIRVGDDPALSAVKDLQGLADTEVQTRFKKADAVHQQCWQVKEKIAAAFANNSEFSAANGLTPYTPDALEIPSLLTGLSTRLERTEKQFLAAKGQLDSLIGEAKELVELAAAGKPLQGNDAKELADIEAAAPSFDKNFGSWNKPIIRDWGDVRSNITSLKIGDQPQIKELLAKANEKYDAYSLAYGEAGERFQDLTQLLKQIKQGGAANFANKDEASAELRKTIDSVKKLHTMLEQPSGRMAGYQDLVKTKRQEAAQLKPNDDDALDDLLTNVNQRCERLKFDLGVLNRAGADLKFIAQLAERRIGKLKVDKKLQTELDKTVAATEKDLAPLLGSFSKIETDMKGLLANLSEKRAAIQPAEDPTQALARKAELQTRHQKLASRYQEALLSQSFPTDKLKSLNQSFLVDLGVDALAKAAKTFGELEILVRRALATKANGEKQGFLQQAVLAVPKLGTAAELFPAKGADSWKGEADRGGLKGKGKEFGAVLKAWEAVEKNPIEKNLVALEKAARAYIADHDAREEGQIDDTSKFKYAKCKEALQNIRCLRVEQARDDLKPPPWNAEEEAAARAVQSQAYLETGGGEENESHGASESYWIKEPKGQRAAIFKPADGEADPSYGWKKGGGAAREVMLSSLNEHFKDSLGLDFGVSRTSMATLENESFKSERNGGNTRRAGAVQEFVPADKTLTEGVQKKDQAVLSRIAPEETQKALLMDFVTLQMDRQADNFLVQKNENGDPHLIPIDAGNALPSRKAFNASRRMLVNNAAFDMPGGDRPFSDEMQEKIAAMDEEKIVGAMAQANKSMAAVDPASEGMIDDENVENSRRSIRFLKKAAAFKPPLTTKAIGELYAFYFHMVLDAKKGGVDKACDDALKEYAANQGIIAQIDAIPNARQNFQELGWPPGNFADLRSEEPARLLKILQDNQPNPVVVKQMNALIKELGGRDKLNFDPDKGTYDNRLRALREAAKAKKMDALDKNPKFQKALRAQGIDFQIVRPNGKKVQMNASEKEKTTLWLEKYEAGGGDKALKKKTKKNVSKMDFNEKVYESLGGDARLEEMKKLGLNPYMSKQLVDRIDELNLFNEFEELGGLDTYVRLGGPQNAQLSMFSRLEIMRSLKRLEK
jgi:hypothetical protein